MLKRCSQSMCRLKVLLGWLSGLCFGSRTSCEFGIPLPSSLEVTSCNLGGGSGLFFRPSRSCQCSFAQQAQPPNYIFACRNPRFTRGVFWCVLVLLGGSRLPPGPQGRAPWDELSAPAFPSEPLIGGVGGRRDLPPRRLATKKDPSDSV